MNSADAAMPKTLEGNFRTPKVISSVLLSVGQFSPSFFSHPENVHTIGNFPFIPSNEIAGIKV